MEHTLENTHEAKKLLIEQGFNDSDFTEAIQDKENGKFKQLKMNWINIEDNFPPKRDKPYQVLGMSKKLYSEGNYEGQQIKTVVQDWVIREWSMNFTHWVEIIEPNH